MMIASREGVWSPVTASIDWCEPNYIVTYYIAEFWNTVSNLGLFWVPLIVLMNGRRYDTSRFKVLCVLTSMIGLGSALFHGTLKFYCQLADELPMLWATLSQIYVLWSESKPGRSNDNKTFLYSLILFGVIWTALSPYTHFEHPLWFEILFVSLKIGVFRKIIRELRLNLRDRRATFLLILNLTSVFLAITFWLTDVHFCSSIWLSTIAQYRIFHYIGSFHGYWHIFMSLHVYFDLMLLRFIYIKT